MSEFIHLPAFEKARVLVVGDVMLDCYWSGPARRMSPEAPVPIVKIEDMTTRPGGAANVALNLVKLGCQVQLVGIVGDDAEGEDLAQQLYQQHVHCHFHIQKKARTIHKLRVIARNQQMMRLDFESGFEHVDTQALLALYSKQLAKADVVIFSDYHKGTLVAIEQMIALARAKQLPIFVDPKGHDYHRYRGATLLTPNMAEFETVVGPCHHDQATIVSKARALATDCELDGVLVTQGKDGMTLVLANSAQPLQLASHAREVFDVTGAGDTVIAVLAACRAAGEDYERAVYLANVAAGLVVAKLGTAFVTSAELREALRQENGVSQGIVTEEALLSIVADARAKGEKIVMTNGCFDLLHPGHIQYLTQAKQLGDRLLVAVNTDESVRRLKGPTRPMNSVQARMEVLAALRCVDWVVPFAEDTPERLIKAVAPDVLVKGGDYTVETVAGHQAVLANGGQVVILPLREGYSTTKILEKAKG